MSKVWRAKAYLAHKGRPGKHDGRGRISKDNHAFLASEAKAGVQFSDWPKGKVITVEATESTPATVKVERDPNSYGPKEVIEPAPLRYDPDKYEAVEASGKRHNLIQACSCGYSLCGHICDTPNILGTMVTIVPKEVTVSAG